MSKAAAAIVWFRNDLRVVDNRALAAAAKDGGTIVPVFILDEDGKGAWPMGGASRWWLHHSLGSLGRSLAALGAPLILRRGSTVAELAGLAVETGARSIHFSRAYEPAAIASETAVRDALGAAGIEVRRYAGALMFEPDAVRTKTGVPYKVYTPFWRSVCAGAAPRPPVPAPAALTAIARQPKSVSLNSLALLPTNPDWSAGLKAAWTPGEAGAASRLDRFLEDAAPQYAEGRNRPDRPGTSRLSPHLHHGEISPATCWHAAARVEATAATDAARASLETFRKELVWREFSYNLLFNWPSLPEAPFNPSFAAFPWLESPDHLTAWQRGQTGYPIVDAGMRELWQTGWMHNRVRMIVGSFLVKNLLVSWQSGEAWFWDTLVDADLAANAASWQWVAGSGADAAPYFRIFNSVKQGETFDPDGAYVRRCVPELARVPTKFIHQPWSAPHDILAAAGVTLGGTYPAPIVDHAVTRARALRAYDAVKMVNTDGM